MTTIQTDQQQPVEQAAPQQPVAASEQGELYGEWIEWRGGDRPVDPDTIVEIRHANRIAPYNETKVRAININWHHPDWIAYRVAKAPTNQPVQAKALTELLAEAESVLVGLNFAYGMHGRSADKILIDLIRDLVAWAAKPSAPADVAAVRDVIAERTRQKEVEGWTAEHDDQYHTGDLASAAACYATQGRYHYPEQGKPGPMWPWPSEWWKPTTYRRNLEKAGALIIAEIERIDRAAPTAQPQADEDCPAGHKARKN